MATRLSSIANAVVTKTPTPPEQQPPLPIPLPSPPGPYEYAQNTPARFKELTRFTNILSQHA